MTLLYPVNWSFEVWRDWDEHPEQSEAYFQFEYQILMNEADFTEFIENFDYDREDYEGFNSEELPDKYKNLFVGSMDDFKDDIVLNDEEMKEFEHEVRAGVPKFGHAPGTLYKDDSVYSLNWAIYATREEEAHERRKTPHYDVLPKTKNRWVG